MCNVVVNDDHNFHGKEDAMMEDDVCGSGARRHGRSMREWQEESPPICIPKTTDLELFGKEFKSGFLT